MNFRIILTVFALGLVFVGCSLESQSNQTPQIAFARFPKLQNGDSLRIMNTSESHVFSLDTVHVGDTVDFVLYMQSYSNELTDFYLTQSADSSALIILPEKASMDSIFLSNSELPKGKFFIKTGFNRMYFPFKYVATEANVLTKIGFSVASDAKFDKGSLGFNSSGFELITPIKP